MLYTSDCQQDLRDIVFKVCKSQPQKCIVGRNIGTDRIIPGQIPPIDYKVDKVWMKGVQRAQFNQQKDVSFTTRKCKHAM